MRLHFSRDNRLLRERERWTGKGSDAMGTRAPDVQQELRPRDWNVPSVSCDGGRRPPSGGREGKG